LRVERFESVPSTNDLLRERARAGAPEWSAVLADAQTAGRGRQGRSWLSPPGNLCLSVLLRPTFDAVGVLPLAAGVAVAEAAAGWGVAARLKWPNDVVVGERKLAGVLAEAVSSGGRVESVILGIGVNLLLDPAEAPEHLRASVTSIRHEGGRVPSAPAAADAILAGLGVWYHSLAREGAQPVVEAWRRLSVAWWGRAVEVIAGDRRISGIARGLDDSGALVLETAEGAELLVVSGDARELRLDSQGVTR
jgi:BirA family biotin operon repressor/biotin-[acetyl-CoA-carboxylase] ligase